MEYGPAHSVGLATVGCRGGGSRDAAGYDEADRRALTMRFLVSVVGFLTASVAVAAPEGARLPLVMTSGQTGTPPAGPGPPDCDVATPRHPCALISTYHSHPAASP